MLFASGAVLVPAPSAVAADDNGCSTGGEAYICVTFATPSVHQKVEVHRADLFQNGACRRCDVKNETRYKTRDADGKVASVDSVTGLSIAALLDLVAPGVLVRTTFTQAKLIDSRSTYNSVLDNAAARHEVTAPGPGSPFADNLAPAVFITDDARNPNAGYLRPLRTSGNDVNNIDNLYTSNDFVHVVVHTDGKVLHPTLSVDGGAKHDGGKPVTFRARVDDAANTALSYAWDFGDGAANTADPTVPHTYDNKDAVRYPVVVVTGADTSYGQSPSVRVEIGRIGTATTGSTPPGGGKTPSARASEGPVRGGGSKIGRTAGRTPGNGAGSGTGGASSTPGPTPGSGGSGSGRAGTGPAAGSATRSIASPRPTSGEIVRGVVLFAPDRPAGAAPRRDGRASAASLRRQSSAGLDLRWLRWLIPIALIAIGVFTERRRPGRTGSTP